MTWTNNERSEAISLVQRFIDNGQGIRQAFRMASMKMHIPYSTLSRWYYLIKERPMEPVSESAKKMIAIGVCYNVKEAMLSRAGAIDRIVKLYDKLTDGKEDRASIRKHYEQDIENRRTHIIAEVTRKHRLSGNQLIAVKAVAREYDLPVLQVTKWYRAFKSFLKQHSKKVKK